LNEIDEMKERNQWKEAIRSKLKDFEAETEPEDWPAIVKRLPEVKKTTVILLRLRRYAAAIIVLLVISGGGFYYYHRTHVPFIAGTFTEKTDRENVVSETTNPPVSTADQASRPLIADASPVPRTKRTPAVTVAKTTEQPEQSLTPPEQPAPPLPALAEESGDTLPVRQTTDEPECAQVQSPLPDEINDHTLIADAKPVSSTQKRSRKRWGFGVGGGSYSVGSNSGAGQVLFAPVPPSRGLIYNAETLSPLNPQAEKQHVSHKYPLSFGLGVGYALNDRWALQSGLTYTMLRSEWNTVSKYLGESKQQLHFIGLPLSVNYKIAEWNRFRFYAATGLMTEWNVAGQIRTRYYSHSNGETVLKEKESVRMKEWQWSANARAGVSYPLIRFVNAYVEGGANYYFDNGSSIETIRSDKPFHVSLQAGIRLGF
jgi:opacity protein-like surface antigen